MSENNIMKLKKLLPYLDSESTVRIYTTFDDDGDPSYEGPVYNVPYRLLNYTLVKSEENNNSEAICPCLNSSSTEPIIRITLKEE